MKIKIYANPDAPSYTDWHTPLGIDIGDEFAAAELAEDDDMLHWYAATIMIDGETVYLRESDYRPVGAGDVAVDDTCGPAEDPAAGDEWMV